MSREALYYVFNTRLPTLENKTVLDIGSRLGAVLYGVSRKFPNICHKDCRELNIEQYIIRENLIIQ